ncbi:MAG: PKD domain-containing protein, partial [Luteibaculum sp.]
MFLSKKLLAALFLAGCSASLLAQQLAPKPTQQRFNSKKSIAQKPPLSVEKKNWCMYDQLLEKKMEDPEYRRNMELFEKMIRKRSAQIEAESLEGQKATVYTIPVVFHIYHVGEALGQGHNIPTEQITSSVEALNRDFRRLATDGGVALGAGPDIEVEFCLATLDPDGNPTNGINRIDASGTGNYENIGIDEDVNGFELKALSKWPTDEYVNIWIVREINDQGEYGEWSGGTAGYAYPVSGSSSINPNVNPSFNPGDGIVVVNFSLGNDPSFNKGWNIYFNQKLNRTLTHEMGHHLNLRHTFHGGSCSEGDCSTEGDFVCDTPPTVLNSNCNSPACSGTQQVGNYMDYTGENCYDMFSAGQKTRMRAVLEGFSRSSLTSSMGCAAGFANADFEADDQIVPIGQTINFTDLSSISPAATSWTWDFGDGQGSSDQNPSHSYTTGGLKTVSLTVSNGSESDTETKVDYIFVNDEADGTIGGNCDTLKNYTDVEAEAFTTYRSNGEVVPGINGNGNEGYAEKFQNTGTYVFQEFLIAIAQITDLGSPSNITFNVYEESGNGTPGNVVTSGTLPFSGLTANSYNLVAFQEPVSVEGNFFIGWEFSPSVDTLGVFATQFRDNQYNSLFVKFNGGWGVFADPAYFSMAIETVPYDEFEVNIIESSQPSLDFCITERLLLEVEDPTNIISYDWSFSPDGNIANSTDPSPVVQFSGEGQKTITLEATGRCGGVKTDDLIAFGYAVPEFTAQIIDASCGNLDGSITLTPEGAAQYGYNWVGQSNATNQLDQVGAGTYTVEVDNGACVVTETFEIKEDANLIAGTFTVVNASCEEENGSVEVNLDQNGNFEFLWNGANTNGGNPLENLGPGSYTLQVKDENGCLVFEGDTTILNEGTIPNVDFSVNPDPIIENESATFSSATPGAGDHLWSFSGGLPNQTDPSFNLTFNDEGTVTVTLEITTPESCVNAET